jgi:hypothetical protein
MGSKRIDCSLPRSRVQRDFSVLVSPSRRTERQSETLGGTGGSNLGGDFKINQAPRQGTKEP